MKYNTLLKTALKAKEFGALPNVTVYHTTITPGHPCVEIFFHRNLSITPGDIQDLENIVDEIMLEDGIETEIVYAFSPTLFEGYSTIVCTISFPLETCTDAPTTEEMLIIDALKGAPCVITRYEALEKILGDQHYGEFKLTDVLKQVYEDAMMIRVAHDH